MGKEGGVGREGGKGREQGKVRVGDWTAQGIEAPDLLSANW